jgi:hypothetical protein
MSKIKKNKNILYKEYSVKFFVHNLISKMTKDLSLISHEFQISIPKEPLENYLMFLYNKFDFSPCVWNYAERYIYRYCNATNTHTHTHESSIFGLIITSLILAIKFCEDEHYSMKYYARITHVSWKILCKWEKIMWRSLDYNLEL